MTLSLSPTQQHVYDRLLRGARIGSLLLLNCENGMGRTALLQRACHDLDGMFLSMGPLIDVMRSRHPYALEETFEQEVMDALKSNERVIVDDLHLLTQVTSAFRYPRSDWIAAVFSVLAAYAEEHEKTLIFGNGGCAPTPLAERAYLFTLEDFTAGDYRQICSFYLDHEASDRLDYEKIYRFAPKLNAYQLKGACQWLDDDAELNTERFIEYLRSRHMSSNVDLSEVQAVDLHDLKGMENVLRSLEANIIVPMENDQLAAELDLKPKRGVLLAGPPGTGKTTIGRALAHRLKSKFFLVDGTFIAGSDEFYARIHRIFNAAQQNAPSILFIDDSDAIFEGGEELGLYRYLLTMLDGLESESAGRVCVIMTAMNIGDLPPALLRSGRIELWLEIGLPDAAARCEILTHRIDNLPAILAGVEVSHLVDATEGFTGADLKRLIEEGKALYAYDRANDHPILPPTDYFLKAVEAVRDNKERYAAAEAASRKRTNPLDG